MAEKSKQLQAKDQKFKIKEDEVRAHKVKIRTFLEALTHWIGQSFTLESLQSMDTAAMSLPQLSLPAKKGKLDLVCEQILLTLAQTRQVLHQKTARNHHKHKQLQQEMKDSAQLRQEIVTDFASLQAQVQEQTERNQAI